MITAIAFTVMLALLVVFQLALAAGAPWGSYAWGGKHPGALPRGLRAASAASVLVYALFAVIALDRAGVTNLFPNAFSQVAMWVIFGYLALGVLMNAASRSKAERAVMTPVALVLAVLALLVAITGPAARTFEGMVLDDGDGPVFCTIVMESYPPQCGGESPAVEGWDWSAVEHTQEQTVRWGQYRFEGTRDLNTITVDGDVELIAP